MTKLIVDSRLCAGHGRCYAHAPALLDYDDAGYVTPLDAEIDVDAGHRDVAQDAAHACPEKAIAYIE